MRDNRDLGPEGLFASQRDGTATHGFAEAMTAELSTGTLSTQVAERDSGVPASPGAAPGVRTRLSPLSLSVDQQRATVTFATALSPKNHPPCTWEARLMWGHRVVPWSFPGDTARSQHRLCKVVAPAVVTPSVE